MKRMKPREMVYMFGGLLAGLVIGAVLIGTSEDMRESLFGTAAEPGSGGGKAVEIDPKQFYLVDLNTAQQWLETVNPDEKGELEEPLSDVAGLTQAGGVLDLGQYFVDKRESFDTVLLSIQDALLTEAGVDEGTALTACIGLDSDPYSLTGPGVYVYVGVPKDMTDQVPSDWTQLAGPKEQNMLWSTACYTGEEEDEGSN